jgi:thymidylate synthase
MKSYLDLMKKIIFEGTKKSDTISLFGESLEFDLREGFPIVTTRKINYQAAFAELACFLKGFTDVKQFKAMGVNFWDHDAYKSSWVNSPFKKHHDDLGKIYGYQWRKGFGVDQIKTLIENLTANPESRRHLLITFNPADLKEMCLPPCYVSHQFYSVDGFLDMLVHQRSADYCIGVPFDLCNFALFQHLLAKDTGLKPRKLKIIFGDVHIYEAHFDKLKEQYGRAPLQKPELVLANSASLLHFTPDMATLKGYTFKDAINYPFQVQN